MNLSFEPLQARHALSAARLALAGLPAGRASAPDLPALTQEVFLRNLMPLMDNGNGVSRPGRRGAGGLWPGRALCAAIRADAGGVFSRCTVMRFSGAERGKLAKLLCPGRAAWMERGHKRPCHRPVRPRSGALIQLSTTVSAGARWMGSCAWVRPKRRKRRVLGWGAAGAL